VVDDLPRTASEKIQSRFLAAALENGIASRVYSRPAVTI
jgi:acyl-coenzyme A synthetase/AMP-(fatty) acid ligase